MREGLEDVELVGVKELSERFGLHVRTIQYLFKSGKLPGLKIGRAWKARVQDVRAYLDEQRHVAAATAGKEGL